MSDPMLAVPTRDGLIEQWQAARAQAAAAYAAWTAAPVGARRDAYAVFLAASDQEAAAEQSFLAAENLGLEAESP
jgi:hypothetical protein